MIIEYESIADVSFYCYFVKSGTPFDESRCYTIKCTPHFHRNIEFLFVTKGKQKVTVDGNVHELTEGDILFVNTYQPHSYDDCDAEAYVLVLSSTYFEPFHWFFENKVFPELMNDKEKNVAIFNFVEQWYENSRDSNDRYSVFLNCNLLFQLIRETYGIEEPILSKQNELVIAALKYINEHYCEDNLTLLSCANAINYSKEYISKQFNNVMGVSFKTYINDLRIKKFKELSKNKKATKQELANACGFRSVATFYRALKSLGQEE